ncbi:hypothetical protein Tco_0681653 [Tanacetum coccineum]|uniref:Uncharacterized protein n=1 Tax=Tanacetum coccineum TaxID=301880 RepID=A0ABQ4XNY2_9ASTR
MIVMMMTTDDDDEGPFSWIKPGDRERRSLQSMDFEGDKNAKKLPYLYPKAQSRSVYLDFGLEELVPSLCVEERGKRMRQETKQRLHHCIEKTMTTDQKILIKVYESLCWRKNRDFELQDTYPILLSFTHCGNKSILRVLRIILVILPEHPSETIVFHNEDGNPARANIKQALGSFKDGDGDGDTQPHKGVKASANSDVMYFFTSAQDDVRLCLDDDLKKAQDHSQRQA